MCSFNASFVRFFPSVTVWITVSCACQNKRRKKQYLSLCKRGFLIRCISICLQSSDQFKFHCDPVQGSLKCVNAWVVLSCALYCEPDCHIRHHRTRVLWRVKRVIKHAREGRLSVLKGCPAPFPRWYYSKHTEACVVCLLFSSSCVSVTVTVAFDLRLSTVWRMENWAAKSSLYIGSTSRRYDKSRPFWLRALLPPLFFVFFFCFLSIASVQIFADENLLTLWRRNIVRVHVN